MQRYSDNSPEHSGISILLIGDTGVGKTTSVIQSAPGPVAFMNIEPRDPRHNLLPANRPTGDIEFFQYTNWDALLEFAAEPKNMARFTSIVADSLTHLMNVELSQELEDISYEASKPAKEKERVKWEQKRLIAETRMDWETWGALASQMNRLCGLLHKYKLEGKVIIYIARLSESVRWSTKYMAAAGLKGKEFPLNLPGYLDLIGLVEHNYETKKNGQRVKTYPPKVSFDLESTLTKWTGLIPEGGVNDRILRVDKIIEAAGWKPATTKGD